MSNPPLQPYVCGNGRPRVKRYCPEKGKLDAIGSFRIADHPELSRMAARIRDANRATCANGVNQALEATERKVGLR